MELVAKELPAGAIRLQSASIMDERNEDSKAGKSSDLTMWLLLLFTSFSSSSSL